MKQLMMVITIVGLGTSMAQATWTYTEDFTDLAWYASGSYKWGGTYMNTPTPAPGWSHSVGPTSGLGLVYPEPRGESSAELYAVTGGYADAAYLAYYGIPFHDQGSVSFSWVDGYSGSAMNLRLMDGAGTSAVRFWIGTRFGVREVQIEANNAPDYTQLIEYTDGVTAKTGDRLYTTVSWDNVLNTVSVSSYNSVSGATSPVRTASLTDGNVDISAVQWFITGHGSGGGSEMVFGAEGITFTSSIPEPATMLLLAAGGVVLIGRLRCRRAR